MARHALYYTLLETLAEPGCAICRMGEKAVIRFLENLVYEGANDAQFRAEALLSRGFCNLHGWQLRDCHGSGLDVAILSRDVVKAWLRRLESFAPEQAPTRAFSDLRAALGMANGNAGARALAEALAPERPCPACKARDTAEQAYIEELLDHCADPEISGGVIKAGGLCLTHFRKVMHTAATAEQAALIAQLQAEAMAPLLQTLEDFICKHDYRFQAEMTATEGESWLKALALLSGQRGTR